MPSLLTPEVWDKVGVVSLAVFLAMFHVVAYMRGWFVPGRYHREIVGAQNQRIEEAHARELADAETMRVQAQTIAERNGSEIAAVNILQSIRDLAASAGKG